MESNSVTNSPFNSAGNGDPRVVPSVDPFNMPQQPINSLQLRPGSVRQTAVGNLVSSSHAGLGNAAFSAQLLPAMTTNQVNFILTDALARTVSGQPDVALFTGITDPSQIAPDNSNQWPNVNFGLSNMPWMPYQNWGITDNVNTVTSVAIRNNTSNDVNVVIAVRWRLVTNQSATFEQSAIS